jgi:hypothetical protein
VPLKKKKRRKEARTRDVRGSQVAFAEKQ